MNLILSAAAVVLGSLAIAPQSATLPATRPTLQPAAIPLEDYQRLETDRYVVLATTQEEAQKSAKQVEYAIEQFERYLGEAPPRVTVLIAEDPATLSLPGIAKLAPRGEGFLPFLTEEKLMAARMAGAGPANLYMLDAGAALMERDGEVTVMSIMTLPGKDPIGLEQSDIIMELNGQDVIDLASFKEQYAKIAAGEPVEIVVQRGSEVKTVSYARPENAPRMQVQAKPGGAAMGEAMKLARAKPLSHEVGHMLLISYANKILKPDGPPAEAPAAQDRDPQPDASSRPGVRVRAGGRIHAYGHQRLPDWFDEAVATLAEVPELQADRQEFLKEHLEERIPLAELFTMEHPLLAFAANAGRAADAKPGDGPRIAAMRIEDAGGVMQRASMFYSQANSLALFLHERGGPGALKQILLSLLSGKSTQDALAEIKNVPSDLVELEQQWLDWVGQQ